VHDDTPLSCHILRRRFVRRVTTARRRDALPSFGRKDYTQDEFDQAKSAVADQLDTYKKLATLVGEARSVDSRRP
jgi:hypothetical protein